jgi:hypothetical protein
MRAALDLGGAGADAALLAPLLEDPERDVRVAAAKALGTASGDAVVALIEALADPSWRVVLAATESLAQKRAGAGELARLLADPVVAVNDAAREALVAAGVAAAVPTAERMESGSYAVLHHAPLLFERLGAAGSAAVPRLATLLAHEDVNVREAAARSLRAIGPAATAATPSLVRALGDERLCVVAHAALALGRIGLSPEAVAALADPSARVRAYAAFAVGWALGASRGVDQVPFEVRLPVLDVGPRTDVPSGADLDAVVGLPREEQVPVLRRGIWSKDGTLAVRSAASLDFMDLDARESERVMEVLLPEGLRPGSSVDFDRLRSIMGSSELAACMMYVVRERRTEPDRRDVYGNLHRIARAEHLPVLCWFERVEEPESLDGASGNVWMPESYTAEHARERATLRLGRDPGPDHAAILRALLLDFLEHSEGGLGQPELWMVNDFVPAAGDAALLLRVARALDVEGDWHWVQGAWWATLRALGRCSDTASREYLAGVAARGGEASVVARAALARRGDDGALRALVEGSRSDHRALLLLLEVRPRLGADVLAQRLSDPSQAAATLALLDDWSEGTTMLGIRLPDEAFLGLEAALFASLRNPWLLGRIAVEIPGCGTTRIASRLLGLLETAGPPRDDDGEHGADWDTEQASRVAAWLHVAEPSRLLHILRAWALSAEAPWRDWARTSLLRLGDGESAGMLVAWLRDQGPRTGYIEWVERLPGPEARAYLRDASQDPREYEYTRDEALAALARLEGWPKDAPFSVEDFPADVRDRVRAWVFAGDIASVRAAHPAPERLRGGVAADRPAWERLGRASLAGDHVARAEFWSALRAGRYRWIDYHFDGEMHTLGHDWGTLPHWISDLDSNCCRVSGGLADAGFERPFGAPNVYGSERMGVGEPLSERLRTWLRLAGGRWAWSPLLDRWLPQPE